MAFEELKAGIALLLEEIEKPPADRLELLERLREQIAEAEAMAMDPPEDLLELEKALEGPDGDRIFATLMAQG